MFVENIDMTDASKTAAASSAPLGVMERLDLIEELGEKKDSIGNLGEGPMAAMDRLDLVERCNEIRTLLGVGVSQAPANRVIINPVPPEAFPAPEVDEVDAVARLRDVAAGKRDGEGLDEMYGIIREAAFSLNDSGLLVGDAEDAANAAITHWAEMEERING